MSEVKLIDANALKEELELSKYIIPNDLNRLLNSEINRCIEAVDNAPTVEYPFYQEAYQTGYEEGKNEKPQVEPVVEITEKQAILFLINSGWLVNHDKELREKWERPQDRWGKWSVSEIQCPNCLEYFQTDCYSKEDLNKCPCCGAKLRD